METKTKLRYVAYARKSTDQEEKQITSIEDQLREIERIGADCHITKKLTEKRTAKTLGRPVFAEMLQLILDKKVDGIVCWKLNRLARNPIDGGQIIWMLQNGVIKEIRTDDCIYTPESDMIMLHIHFGMAHQFSLNLSKDIKRGYRVVFGRAFAHRLLLSGIKTVSITSNGWKKSWLMMSDSKKSESCLT